MKKRSITHRNLLGGFLGGVLGLLLFNLVHPFMAPVGVLLGVVVGYWYQEIGSMIANQWNNAVLMYNNMIDEWQKKPAMLERLSKRKHRVKRFFLIRWIPILRFLRKRKMQWNKFFQPKSVSALKRKKRHPATYAYRIRFFAFLFYLSCNIAFGYFLYTNTNLKESVVSDSGFGGLLFVGCMVLAVCALMSGLSALGLLDVDENILVKMSNFYRLLEEYANLGGIRFFFKKLSSMFLFEFSFFLLMGAISAYWFVAFVLLASFWAIPIVFLIGALRGMYKITKRPNHWLCVVVTLAVTLIVGFTTREYITNVYALWIVALLTGIVSGVLTEWIRSLIMKGFNNNEKVVTFAFTELGTRFAPAMKIINNGSDKVLFGIRFSLLGY